MIRSILLALLLLLSLPVMAQEEETGDGPNHVTGGGGFTGVIDAESTVNHFFGLVAGSQALATSGVNAVDLCDILACALAVNNCTAVKVLSTGQLDTSVGLYCDAGLMTVATWCSSTATCVVGGTARVTGLYDQLNPGTIKAVGAGYATEPDFVLSGFGAKPTMNCVSTRSTILTATISALLSPWSWGATFERNAIFTSFVAYVGDGTAAGGGTGLLGGTGTVNQIQGQVFGDTGIFATATDGTGTADFSHGHRVLYGTPATTGNQTLYLDGSAATPVSMSPGNTNPQFSICGYSGNFSSAFMTAAWTDPTQPSSTIGNAVTALALP